MKTETIQLNDKDVTLTTYILEDSSELLNGRNRPAVLVCPGGAYLGCSDREAEPVALRFAAMGYHAFVLRYSTYFGTFEDLDVGSELPVNPNSIHPAPMRDIGKAFLTIRAHADEWLVDVDKIAICGFSAGGHNCAMYAVYWHQPVLYDHFDVNSDVLKPAAVLVGYPVTDYHLMRREKTESEDQDMSNTATLALFGTTTPAEDLLDTLSPALHITEQTPPMFIWATAADNMVPVENSTRLASALAQEGIPFEIHVFEEGMHGLSLADQSTAGALHNINKDAAKWIGLAEAWLKKRFALELPGLPD